MTLVSMGPCLQQPLGELPYDSWLGPDGDLMAEFHRLPSGFLVRFPEQADFAIDLAAQTVCCAPASDDMRAVAQSLFHNAIEPLVGNFSGGLFLHGSAVSAGNAKSGGGGIAFLGESRRGKTTLAGGFAKAGHPFLSEDTVVITQAGGTYQIEPSRPVLRLFADSARHLMGTAGSATDHDGKSALEADSSLPFAQGAQPLAALYLLGPGESSSVSITRIPAQAALAQLLRHAFILDVEDKPRLRGHFQRLGELAASVPCFTLDFPRIYAQLGEVVEAIHQHATSTRSHDAN